MKYVRRGGGARGVSSHTLRRMIPVRHLAGGTPIGLAQNSVVDESPAMRGTCTDPAYDHAGEITSASEVALGGLGKAMVRERRALRSEPGFDAWDGLGAKWWSGSRLLSKQSVERA